MRLVIVMLMILTMAASVLASDLGNTSGQPAKSHNTHPYQNPEGHKQGGDTVDDAVPIGGLPYTITGTTEGFVNDYDVMCPYGSNSPDVVYSFTPAADILLTVDLCGSSYDTKIYIYDPDFILMGCNDDFYFPGDPCGDYTSKLEDVTLPGGITYYIVVDGYGGYFGEYVLTVSEGEECFVYCPADAVAEGEPPLGDGYDDQYNVGCGGHPPVFQSIDWTNDEDGVPPFDGTAWLCGKSGWFIFDGLALRDTDWFSVFALETGQMEATLEPEHPCLLIKVAPIDCEEASPELNVPADCGEPGTLVFPVTAGEEIWLWVGPSDFFGPVTEFTYFLTVSNNMFDVVSSEDKTWGGVKALYR